MLSEQAGVKMKGKKTALLVAGIFLASMAESTGPIWILAAAGSFASFAALLVICVRQAAAAPVSHIGRERKVETATFLPSPAASHLRQGDMETGTCINLQGWASTGNPLPPPVPSPRHLPQPCRRV